MRCISRTIFSWTILSWTILSWTMAVVLSNVFFVNSLCADEFRDQMEAYKQRHALDILASLGEFMRIPNVSSDQDNVRKNAEYLVRAFTRRGAEMQLLEVPAANPVVYGELLNPHADRTVIIYAHFDGQPVNPSRWTATQPFEPAIYSRSISDGGAPVPWPTAATAIDPEWRIYGRSASDDKAPFVALLTALDALAALDMRPTSNLKFFFDGEEEIGSPHMERVLTEHREKFGDVDLWVFCDGPLHQSRQATLYYGVRGISALDLTVYGAKRNLHSGHYGNWAPNPAMRLANLLASMKDADDNITVDGFFDSVIPLTPAERQALDRVPAIDDELRKELGLKQTENQNENYLLRMQLPSLNVRGLQCATVGKTARNIVPNQASASIDVRLVKGNHPTEMLERIERHIEKQGYLIVRDEPTAAQRTQNDRIVKITRKVGYPAARTAMGDAAVAPLARRLESMLGPRRPLLQIPSLGGSLPLYLITQGQRKPLVILPLANHDNNQHAPDENLRWGNLLYGIDAMAAVLTMND